MKKITEILVHLIFWLLYLANTIFFSNNGIVSFGYFHIGIWYLSFFVIVFIIFYINYLFLIPRYLSERKYLNYLTSVFTLIIIFFLLYLAEARFFDWYFKSGNFYLKNALVFMPNLIFQIILYLLISTGTKFTIDWFKNLELKEQLAKEKTLSEIKLLKSQISPHFLFNTLNNLYSLVQRKSDEAPEAVLMLSDLMRYMLKENSKEKIELVKEISYVKSYIELQRLRLSNPNIVKSEILIDNATAMISPMLLIPFVENTFKHADITSENAIIEFKLELKNNRLFFNVVNNIGNRKKDETTGVGLKNVKRRLDLLYPNNHKLEIRNEDNKFHVELELNLS